MLVKQFYMNSYSSYNLDIKYFKYLNRFTCWQSDFLSMTINWISLFNLSINKILLLRKDEQEFKYYFINY